MNTGSDRGIPLSGHIGVTVQLLINTGKSVLLLVVLPVLVNWLSDILGPELGLGSATFTFAILTAITGIILIYVLANNRRREVLDNPMEHAEPLSGSTLISNGAMFSVITAFVQRQLELPTDDN